MSKAKQEAAGLVAVARAERWAKRKRLVKLGTVLAVIAAMVVLLPVVLMAGVVWGLLARWPDRFWRWVGLTVAVPMFVGGVAATVGYWQAVTTITAGQGQVSSWLVVIGYGLLCGPLLGVGAAWLDQSYRERAPLGGQQIRERREHIEDARLRWWTQRRQAAAYGPTAGSAVARVVGRSAVPLGDTRGPFLGTYLRGDLDWRGPRGRVQVPWARTGHIHVEGRSQSGKSELVYGITEWYMAEVGGQVVRINCKQAAPGAESARRLAAHAEVTGLSCNVLLAGTRPYDIMRGSTSEVRQRLMDVELFSEPHHEAGTNLFLAFGLEKMATEGRPARDLAEVLREVMDRARVTQWAAQSPFAARLLAMIDERSWNGAAQRYASDALDLHGWTGGEADGGWAIEDADVSVLDLPTSSEPKAARMLLRLVLADLIAYLTNERRQRQADGSYRPLLIVLEELSALDSDPKIARSIVNLMERALGADARFVVVSQDATGLGSERERSAVLTNSTVVSFAQVTQAQTIAELGGTRQVAEASAAYQGRMYGRMEAGSVRYQDQFAVNPNELRSLSRGEAFVFDGGRYLKLAATMGALGYQVPASAAGEELDQVQRHEQFEQPGVIGEDGTPALGWAEGPRV